MKKCLACEEMAYPGEDYCEECDIYACKACQGRGVNGAYDGTLLMCGHCYGSGRKPREPYED